MTADGGARHAGDAVASAQAGLAVLEISAADARADFGARQRMLVASNPPQRRGWRAVDSGAVFVGKFQARLIFPG